MTGGTTPATLTVSDLLDRISGAVAAAYPGPVWVRGEVTGFRRTSGGAAFFRLADPESDDHAIEVGGRGRIMREVDRVLDGAGVGALRDGIEVRLRATVGIAPQRSLVRLSLLEVDPAYIAGRLAVDRQEILRRLRADGSLERNRRVPVPMVPLKIGLVTSRGSAAHADFLDQLHRSGYRFAVRTAHAAMQGDGAVAGVAGALRRFQEEEVDAVALVRGGGSKLDLAAFDSEEVARAVAAMRVPVITGIGHEIDLTIADEAAAISVKTPTAAGEWLVTRVGDYADRIEVARKMITEEARASCARAGHQLDNSAARLAGVRATMARQHDHLDHLQTAVSDSARRALAVRHQELDGLEEVLGALGIEETLGRGFALVMDRRGRVVRSVTGLSAGDRLEVRLADGIVGVTVEGSDD